MIIASIYLTLLLGFGTLTVSFFSRGSQPLFLIPLLMAVVWMLAIHSHWKWIFNLVFFFGIALLASTCFLEAQPLPIILNAVFLLAAWDLTNFQSLLDRAPKTINRRKVEHAHLVKLSVFLLIALALNLASRAVEIKTSFFQSLALVVFSFFGLLQMARGFVKRKDPD